MPRSSFAVMSSEEGNKVIVQTQYTGASFSDLLRQDFPHLLTRITPDSVLAESTQAANLPMGTTILALCYHDGVIIAGDRRAVEGHHISSRRIEKVYQTDQYSAMAVAGVAGLCIEMAKLFRTELEHYEKIEGEQLVLDGKANKLAHMIRQNLPAAMQGLVVVPIFVGYDPKRQQGRIFKYDVVGGMYEETEYYATGSGGKDARNTIKKLYRPDLDEDAALKLAIEALHDAAEEDAATAGPDLLRNIFPNIKTVTARGVQDVADERLEIFYTALLSGKFGPGHGIQRV
jgi:proteasome beta subunit